MASNNIAVRALMARDSSLNSYGVTEVLPENGTDGAGGQESRFRNKRNKSEPQFRWWWGALSFGGEPKRGELWVWGTGTAPYSPLKVPSFPLGLSPVAGFAVGSLELSTTLSFGLRITPLPPCRGSTSSECPGMHCGGSSGSFLLGKKA